MFAVLGVAFARKSIPLDAQRVIADVRAAANAADFIRLRAAMDKNFEYNFVNDSPDKVIEFWMELPVSHPHSPIASLRKVLTAGCTMSDSDLVVCPPAAATKKYYGYRVGFKRTNEGWRWVWFVAGD
jgi:hypothetical protein